MLCFRKTQPELHVIPEGYDDTKIKNDKNKWYQAVEEGLQSLKENAWTLVSLIPGKKATEDKWVFKVKRDGNGNVERHKARLLMKGRLQRKGFDQTYARLTAFRTSKTFCQIGSLSGWCLCVGVILNSHFRSYSRHSCGTQNLWGHVSTPTDLSWELKYSAGGKNRQPENVALPFLKETHILTAKTERNQTFGKM